MALGGRLVVNIITIENLGKATEAIKAMNFREFEVVQMQVSRGRPVGTVTLMEAMNPIYILSATK
jgi:cobalt-precorrin-6B (C15)-methyltransferase